jgi:hypothetical protein
MAWIASRQPVNDDIRRDAHAAKSLSLLVLTLLFVVANNCAVSSDHPVSRLEESETVPDRLLGTWKLVEVAGIPAGSDGASQLSFERDASGFLKYTLTERDAAIERNASLATIGGRMILSMPPEVGEESWGLALLSFDEATQELTISFLGHAELVRDIRAGVVAGEVYQFDQRELAHLTASTAELRAYLAVHQASFSDRIAVLNKQAS